MGIDCLTEIECERMRRAGQVAAETLAWVGSQLRVGMSTAEIDRLVREDTRRRGATPSQLGYHGFPASVCTSRNQVVCHGIPSEHDVLAWGDIVNVDVTSCFQGYHGDTSRTFCLGEPPADVVRLVQVAERCLEAGISVVRAGARLGDVGAAIEEVATAAGLGVVREYGGHGIGRRMHAPPHVAHYGRKGSGHRLKAGMAFTIEPMINLGGAEVVLLADGWTVVTADGRPSAQFEHTVLVTSTGAEVLTRLERGLTRRRLEEPVEEPLVEPTGAAAVKLV
jgi:methionyl aminopeptidase